MATIADLVVKLSLDDNSFQRQLQSTRDKLDKWGSNFRSWGTKLTAGVTTPIVGAGLAFVNWASDLEQAFGKSEAVFGDQANAVQQWSESTAKSYGFAQSESLAMASTYGSLFKVMGMSNEVAADYSMQLIGLSADMAAFNDVSNERASQALMAGLSGEYMSLRSMGVFLNEAQVSQEALNIAMADGREEITDADKVQARYNLIMEQTAQQHGQAAREMDGWASSMARARALAKNLGADIGRKLMPYALKLLDIVERLVDWFGNLSDRTQFIIIAIAAFAAALGPVLLVIGMLMPGLSALLAVIGFLVSPIGLVVIAVAALVAGLVWAYFEFEAFREIVNSVASTIRDVAVAAFEKLVEVFNKLKDAFDAGGWLGMFTTLNEMMLNGLQQLSILALQGLGWLAGRFVEALPGMLAAGASLLQSLWDGAVNKWNEFTGWLGGRAANAATWIGDTTSSLKQKGSDLLQGLWNGATEKWSAIALWVSLIPSGVLNFIGNLTSTLWQKGVDLIVGMGNGVTAQWANLKTWFTNLPTYIFNAIGTVTGTLASKGRDIISGFYEGVTTRWVAVRTWFINLPTMIFNAVGSLTKTLWERGTQAITGFYMAVVDKWTIGGVRNWFTGLGGKIVSAVGSLGSTLYNAGVAVMEGLWNGMKAKWNEITGWLSHLNPANYKGPERRDRKMLYMPGIWIMEGLQRGLSEGWDDVTRQLSGYNPAIAGDLLSGRDGIAGSTVVNHNYYITPPELLKLMQNAEAGGNFARGFAGELGMVEGIA